MGRAALAIATTVAGLVLLLTFKTHGTTALSTPPPAVSTPTPAASTTTATTTTKKEAVSTGTTTVTGDVEQNQYGPVQVQITVKNGAITAVTATQYPSGDPRSQQINAYAIPLLNQEAAQAKSAKISFISGASYTSDSYIASLQTALTRAGIA